MIKLLKRYLRIKELIKLNCPDVIVKNEKRMLYETLDAILFK
jgi:DNA-directed RNA polymerase beta' subunit